MQEGRGTMTDAAKDAHPRPLGGDALARVAGGHPSLAGTHEADNLQGGEGNDIVLAGRGDDEVSAGAGDDSIDLGAGDDVAHAGTGADTVIGGTGRDTVSGNEGDDRIEGGAGDGVADNLHGTEGNDTYVWAPGDGSDYVVELPRIGAGEVDTVELVGVSFAQLLELQRDGHFASTSGRSFEMRLQDGIVTFHGANGSPVSLSATLRIGGETLTFWNIEQFRLV